MCLRQVHSLHSTARQTLHSAMLHFVICLANSFRSFPQPQHRAVKAFPFLHFPNSLAPVIPGFGYLLFQHRQKIISQNEFNPNKLNSNLNSVNYLNPSIPATQFVPFRKVHAFTFPSANYVLMLYFLRNCSPRFSYLK